MNRRLLVGFAIVLGALLAAAAIDTTAYRAGVVHGLSEAGRLPAPDASGRAPGPWGHGPFWMHGPYWAHGPFGIILPLLGVLLVVGVVRALVRGRCLGGTGTSTNVPAAFEEWHRRLHEPPRDRSQQT
jgi:hypothetical protein